MSKPNLNDADIKLLEEKFATKEDVKLIVKQETKQFATKDDLKQFATKDDLKQFATKDDLIGLVHINEMDEKIDAFRGEVNGKLDKLINILDNLVGEMKTYREEQTVTGHRLQSHEDRITTLESTKSLTN